MEGTLPPIAVRYLKANNFSIMGAHRRAVSGSDDSEVYTSHDFLNELTLIARYLLILTSLVIVSVRYLGLRRSDTPLEFQRFTAVRHVLIFEVGEKESGCTVCKHPSRGSTEKASVSMKVPY